MVHGMLGQGKNLRSFARRIVRKYPFFDVLLVDLRGHGKSLVRFQTQKIQQRGKLRRRPLNLFNVLEIEVSDVLIGHSFGGKVATSFLKHLNLLGRLPLCHEPGYGILSLSTLTFGFAKTQFDSQVLEALKGLENPIKSRPFSLSLSLSDISLWNL